MGGDSPPIWSVAGRSRRRTHRGNKIGARVATTRDNYLPRDGPHTWRSLYCAASLLIQTLTSYALYTLAEFLGGGRCQQLTAEMGVND